MHSRYYLLAIAALALGGACGGGGGDATTGPTGGTTGGGPTGGSSGPTATSSVTVSDNKFEPASIQVAPGTTVTWTWSSSASTHNVTFGDGTSGDKSPPATFQKTFPTAGTFSYQCTLHAGMNGSVLVQ